MSRRLDAAETGANMVLGLGISFGMTLLVFPLIGIETDAKSAGVASGFYFVTSMARSYGLRRLFRWVEGRV